MRFCSFIFLALMTAAEVSSFEIPRFHPTKRITATQLSADKKITNVGRALMNGSGGVRSGDSDHESPYGTSGRGSYATNLKADAADNQNRPEPVYYAETAAAEETPAVAEEPAVAEPEAPVAVAPPEPPAPVADPVPAPPPVTTTANRVALTNGGTQGSVLLPGQFETVDHTAPYGKMSDYGSVAERNPRSKPLTATTLPKVMVPASDDALRQQEVPPRTRTRNRRTPNYAPTTQGLVPLHYDGQETQQITSTATKVAPTAHRATVAAAPPTAEQFFPDKMDSSTDSTSHKNTATTATGQLRRSTLDPFLPDTVKVKASHASGKARLTNVGRETFQSGGTDIPLVASSDRFVPQPKQKRQQQQQQLQPTASANNMPYDTTTFNHQMSIQITPTKE